MSVAALIGNGLSIAYNPDLSIPSLTAELLRRFRAGEGDLQALAADINEEDDAGFEDLLGPFDALSAMIGSLPGIRSAGGGWAPGFDRLGQSLEAARGIHRRGTGIALELIADRSEGGPNRETVDRLCGAIADLDDDPANLTVATLNYDGLLTSGFLQEWIDDDWQTGRTLDTSDMGDGRTHEQIQTDFSAGQWIDTWQLRRTNDFLTNAACLLNLHGSLGWLRNTNNPDDVRRFRIQNLRRDDYWTKNSRQETAWEPVVVLTSRKTDLVQEWPFALCYAELRKALNEADRWLIVGYGMADDPVNAAIHAAVGHRQRRRLDTKVLVIGHGDHDVIRQDANRRLGIPQQWLSATGEGLPDALESVEWGRWCE